MAGYAATANAPVTSYSNIALAGTGKKGILKKLDNDYFEIILGAFGAFGNGGWLYDTATAMAYIQRNPQFIDMMQKGRCRSEWGHPRRLPGMTDQEWFIRINEIMESNTSSHIRRISTSMDTVVDEKGRKVVAIIGEVRASGPKADEFRRQLENPYEDVNYSIRCFAAKNFTSMRKHINRIITWDNVFEPGIGVATKYNTPSMESKSDVCRMLDYAEFNIERLRHGMTEHANDESFESVAPYVQILDSLTYVENPTTVAMPKSFGW